MIRKFYAATTDPGAGAATEVISEMPEVNMAEMMAKHGRKSGEGAEPPPVIEIPGKEKKQDEEPAKAAATATDAKSSESNSAEPAKTEPVVEKQPEVKAPIVPETTKQPTLEEVLKQSQPNAVFKALGFDDQKASFVSELGEIDPKMVGILQAYKNGNLGDYVRELSTDYNQMSDEDVMRLQLQKDYPKASKEVLDALYESEIIERYKLDPDAFTEADVNKGKLLLSAKAGKIREELIANQQNYLLPKPPEQKQPDNTAEIEAKQRMDAYRDGLTQHPYTKDIITNKYITLGEGEEKFNYPTEAQPLIEVLTNPQKWAETMWDTDTGEPKIQHQLAVAAFALDSEKFLSEYAKHLKAVGAKQVIDPIENAKPPGSATPAKSEAAPESLAALMAKAGRKVSGGS